MATIFLEYGCLADPISHQLDEYDIGYDTDDMEGFQTDANALNRLKIRRLLTHTQTIKAFDKLNRRVIDHVKEL